MKLLSSPEERRGEEMTSGAAPTALSFFVSAR